jgi:hypothetical protein
MYKSVLAMMTESEKLLLWETEASHLSTLDEDAVVELHTRVRRARTKYSKLYRRRASAQVKKDAARYAASTKSRPAAQKAEVFEDALARVSRRLATLARASANEIRAERLAAVRGQKAGTASAKKAATRAKATPSTRPTRSVTKDGRAATQSPSRKKRQASTLAAGARRQAKRDSR